MLARFSLERLLSSRRKEPAPPANIEQPCTVPLERRPTGESFRILSRPREYVPRPNRPSLGSVPLPPTTDHVDVSPSQPPPYAVHPGPFDNARHQKSFVGFEYSAFPHLLDMVIQYASRDTLMTLRLTCREVHRRASVVLYGHLVLMCGDVVELPNCDAEPVQNILPLPPLPGPWAFVRPPVRGRWPGLGTSNPDRRISEWHTCYSWPELGPLLLHTRVVDLMGQDVVWTYDRLLEWLRNVDTVRSLWGPDGFIAPPQQEVPPILPPRLYLYGSGMTPRRLVLDGRIAQNGLAFVKKHAALVDQPRLRHIECVVVNLSYTPDWNVDSGMIWSAAERADNPIVNIRRRDVVVVLHNSPGLLGKAGVFCPSILTLAQDMARTPHVRYTLVGATEVPHPSIGFSTPPEATEIRDHILDRARECAAQEGVPWDDDVWVLGPARLTLFTKDEYRSLVGNKEFDLETGVLMHGAHLTEEGGGGS